MEAAKLQEFKILVAPHLLHSVITKSVHALSIKLLFSNATAMKAPLKTTPKYITYHRYVYVCGYIIFTIIFLKIRKRRLRASCDLSKNSSHYLY